LKPQRKGNAFWAPRPSSLRHNPSRIERAGVDDRLYFTVADQHN
jgi:hypothetical protein